MYICFVEEVFHVFLLMTKEMLRFSLCFNTKEVGNFTKALHVNLPVRMMINILMYAEELSVMRMSSRYTKIIVIPEPSYWI